MQKNKLIITPFVKWVGGKRQLITEIEKRFPKKISKYYEPFVGGGAVLFHLQPKNAIINDCNEELINLYCVIKNDTPALLEDLKKHQNEENYFYEIRHLDRDPNYKNLSNIERASRIFYLNKTCFNGLFRVNKAGEFNSPFGKYKNPNFLNEITLKAVSNFLNENDITILNTDFEDALKTVKKNDFVYLDPPYDPISNSANFTGYTQGGFDKNEQIRLKNVCQKIHAAGAKFLLSNSASEFIIDLYKDFKIEIVKAKRNINSDGDKRGEIDEVLIRNYE